MLAPQINGQRFSNFLMHWQLLVVCIISLLVGVGMWWFFPKVSTANIIKDPWLLMSLLLFFPLVEELLFRGVIQAALLQRPFLAIRQLGISPANLITSILFVGLHLFNHSPAWALAVLLPSLTLGYMREHYQNLVVPIYLHIFFNATYLIAGFF